MTGEMGGTPQKENRKRDNVNLKWSTTSGNAGS